TIAVTIDGKRALPALPVALVPPVRAPWAEDASASYVASTLDVPKSTKTDRSFAKASLVLDIAHTYKSDLRVELMTPGGKRVVVFDRTGGGDNNIRGTFAIDLPAGTKGPGVWRLVVSDHAALDTGSIDAWKLTLGD